MIARRRVDCIKNKEYAQETLHDHCDCFPSCPSEERATERERRERDRLDERQFWLWDKALNASDHIILITAGPDSIICKRGRFLKIIEETFHVASFATACACNLLIPVNDFAKSLSPRFFFLFFKERREMRDISFEAQRTKV